MKKEPAMRVKLDVQPDAITGAALSVYPIFMPVTRTVLRTMCMNEICVSHLGHSPGERTVHPVLVLYARGARSVFSSVQFVRRAV